MFAFLRLVLEILVAFAMIRSLLQVVLRAFRGMSGTQSGESPNPPLDRATAHVTMYALDAVTRKELWNSGDAIAATNHFSGMSVANGHAYVGTVDGIVYCFGVEKSLKRIPE